MIRLRRTITEGARLPAGWGIAHAIIGTRMFACYPVPLNLIVRALRNAWLWCAQYRPHPDAIVEWDRGYEAGRKAAREDTFSAGYTKGYVAGLKRAELIVKGEAP